MAFKILSGTYSAGYTLSPRISLLSITASGLIEGSGLLAAASATVVNAGTVKSGAAATGKAGYAGIDLAAGGRLANSGVVDGGAGGAGLYGGYGGVGGAGLRLGGAGTLSNGGSIIGGVGGVGYQGNQTHASGYGGQGGDGLVALNAVTVLNTGLLAGGKGGPGGAETGLSSGDGGAGGDGMRLAGPSVVTNKGTIAGGDGGSAGYAYPSYRSGLAGKGGVAIQSAGALTLTNAGVVEGGYSFTYYARGFGHGVGGAVAIIAGTGSSIDNRGLISGGAGAGFYQPGGVGVQLADQSILSNLGTIAGGSGGYDSGAGGVALIARGTFGHVGVLFDTVANAGLIQGGAGAGGEYDNFRHSGTPGGAGGAGAQLYLAIVNNTGVIRGGAGGDGGGGYSGSVGGAGGAGVVTGQGGLTNSGLIAGGAGGGGGAGGYGYGANGGNGGDGVDMAGNVVTNLGSIVGGAGGAGGYAYRGHSYGNPGRAGDGVLFTGFGGQLTNAAGGYVAGYVGVDASNSRGVRVLNAGTIAGQMDSVIFHSAGDYLLAQSGAKFTGEIIGGQGTLAVSGGVGTLTGLGSNGVMSGSASGSFTGFGSYEIVAGRWAVTGTNSLDAHENLTTDVAVRVTGAFSDGTAAVITARAALIFAGVSGTFAGDFQGSGNVAFVGGTQAFVGGASAQTEANLQCAKLILNHDTASLAGTFSLSVLSVNTANLTIAAGGATLDGGTLMLGDASTNRVTGQSIGSTLTNGATIQGAGMLGGGAMNLVNLATGLIDGTGVNALVIDTGASVINNAGLIEATGAGGVTIASAVTGAGRLEANGGTLTANAGVDSSQSGMIAKGVLAFGAAFSGAVSFTGSTGVLQLAQSQSYSGTITGFSAKGGTSLDLADIGFVGAGEASFAGTASQGVLTVTDGTHTAHITLIGDYLATSFVAASDGHGGVVVTAGSASSHAFVATMAGLSGAGGGLAGGHVAPISATTGRPALAVPVA